VLTRHQHRVGGSVLGQCAQHLVDIEADTSTLLLARPQVQPDEDESTP
jgi:hypothetical protein